MLFDLRGGGRRRAIQAIYLTLAILMGGGLVLFGIGGATSGGLVDVFSNGGGGTSSDDLSNKQLAEAEAKVRADRGDAKAWAQLARVRATRATGGIDRETGVFNDEGKAELQKADTAWQRSLAIDDKGDPNVARVMIQVYGEVGLNEPVEVVKAMEIILDHRKEPTADLYGQYAGYAYLAGQDRKGDLAAKKAVELTPRRQRKATRRRLEQLKADIAQQKVNAATGAAGSTSGGASGE